MLSLAGRSGWVALSAMGLFAVAGCGRSTLSEGLGAGGLGGQGGAATSSTSSGRGGSGGGEGGAGGAGGAGGQGGDGGASPSCLGPSDCDDGDSCTSDRCESGSCTHKLRDDDGDGFVAAQCGGNDCNDANPNVNPGHPEECRDAADNDCNGVADCKDPACDWDSDCGCVPSPGGESCTNGKDDDCNGTVDCNDPACVGTAACGCSASEVGLCGDGRDDDCDGRTDCDDSDCAATPACQCASQVESCTDGIDNNCNGLVDCADPTCVGSFACTCLPPGTPEACGNKQDDDCDGKVDCQDLDCRTSPLCKQCVAEVCDDGVDNSCDGKIDCADPACAFSPSCPPKPELCNNGIDDDLDGKTDCQDADCATNPTCVIKQPNCLSPKLIPGSGTYTGDTTGNIGETKGACGGDAGEAVFYFVLTAPTHVTLDTIGTSFDSTLYVRTGQCNSGHEIGCDDDTGGNHAARLNFDILYPGTYYVFLDGYTVDPSGGANEGPFVLNANFDENPSENCDDGADNDGDHYVDCADPDCTSVGRCLNCNNGKPPTPEMGRGACTDGQDNDCDGEADCSDDDCSASDYYITECCNGLDKNNNGVADDFNCRCASNAECASGELCYTHTSYTCGIPCTSYFGDICPFVAAGSYCNATTGQCEF